jgi:pilus assembly protein CpaE
MLQVTGSSELVMSTFTRDQDALSSNIISIALICPEEKLRRPTIDALTELRGSVNREFSSYPDLDDLPRFLEAAYDVVIIELDSNPEYALDLIESISVNSSATVMVCSSRAHPEMIVRCMRAGAREFLSSPVTSNAIAEALVRAAVRRPATRSAKRSSGKLMVFIGAKGGSGVTTVACNFAIGLAMESGKSALLIDLNLPLGDVALELGISPQYSTANALQDFNRLDYNFLSRLITRHSSGLSVLAAPDRYTEVEVSTEAVEKLVAVAQQNFDYVIVDAGSRFGATGRSLFVDGATVYLVTQVGISDLRNSNRLISNLLKTSGANVEVVLNRFTPHSLLIDEESITRALTMPAQWKIPSDYAAARTAQNTATPLALKDTPISRAIGQMARMACGLPPDSEKKRRFGLFK